MSESETSECPYISALTLNGGLQNGKTNGIEFHVLDEITDDRNSDDEHDSDDTDSYESEIGYDEIDKMLDDKFDEVLRKRRRLNDDSADGMYRFDFLIKISQLFLVKQHHDINDIKEHEYINIITFKNFFCFSGSEDGQKPYEERDKTVLIEKGQNHFDVLPEGWIQVTHNSGMPLYLHKTTRVCTLSKPYFLGKYQITNRLI